MSMQKEEFYQKLIHNINSVTWMDMLSECKKKHSKQELELALQAGTSLNSATEADMLKKWKKPWIFFPVAKVGLALVALVYALFAFCNYTDSLMQPFYIMVNVIPPFVMPLLILLFLWELNIPKNISLYELVGCFVVGGLVSIVMTGLLYDFIDTGGAPFAAFREEPAKFITAYLLLYLFSRKKKVYGLTGLLIGAAVGAGFGAFESVSYAMGISDFSQMIENQIMRGIFSFGGHTVMSALYMGACALEMKKLKFQKEGILSGNFWCMLIASVILHFLWNLSIFSSRILELAKYIVIIVIFWILLLYITRLCMQQAVEIGMKSVSSPDINIAQNGQIIVQCVKGYIEGAVWQSYGKESLYIGREVTSGFRIAGNAKGISRRHCCIQKTSKGWSVRDLNSSYGTYLNNVRLMPENDYTLHSGDVIGLAKNECVLKVQIH